MKASEINLRRQQITELLYKYNEIKVGDLVDKFQVSDETIRKDLAYLEEEGIVKKKYGGASLVKQPELAPVLNRTPFDLAKKKPIVDAAFQEIPSDSCSIGLDQGSTVALLAHLLQKATPKQIFTGSLAAILELVNSHHDIYCFGGKYAFDDMAFHNDASVELYPDIQLDYCFFGSSGVLHRHGFCTSSLVDAEIKRKLLKKSTKKILLLDETKFEKSSLVQVAPWEMLDLVITNSGIPAEVKKEIQEKTTLLCV